MIKSGAASTPLFHHLEGHGPPILTLHGGMGLDHTYLRPALDGLADTRTLVYFDQRGNGRSPDAPGTYTMAGWAEEANAFRDDLGLGRVVLFGHSYGAFTALEYALRFGDTLDGLILCAGAPAFDYTDVVIGNARARATDAQFASLMQLMAKPAPDDDALRDGWGEIAPIYFHRFDPVVGARMLSAVRYRACAYNEGAASLATFDLRARLGEIRVPVLLISGVDDWITPLDQGARRLEAGIPHADLVVIDAAGHFPMVEREAEFERAVRTWVGRLQ